jgi:AcrR family transcriptional regulator
MPTQAERTQRTRGKLLAAGRELFGEQGFAATSIEDLVQHAGLTRGALYHHFQDKTALFAAVFEDVEQELMAAAGKAAAREPDALASLRAGCRAFLNACADPEVQRIALIDAPAALGWDAWRAVEERYALAPLRAIVEAAMASGQIKNRPADPLAHLLLGAVNEAAMHMARAPRRSDVRQRLADELDALIDGLR